MWKMRYEMANKTGKGGHWVECKNQGCLEPDVMAYLEGPEVVKDAKMTYVKKGRKCRRITKKKESKKWRKCQRITRNGNSRYGQRAERLPKMGIQKRAKVPIDNPKWENKKWPKSRKITQNGNLDNGQSAEVLPNGNKGNWPKCQKITHIWE